LGLRFYNTFLQQVQIYSPLIKRNHPWRKCACKVGASLKAESVVCPMSGSNADKRRVNRNWRNELAQRLATLDTKGLPCKQTKGGLNGQRHKALRYN